jgi:hypothetical protein
MVLLNWWIYLLTLRTVLGFELDLLPPETIYSIIRCNSLLVLCILFCILVVGKGDMAGEGQA